MNVARAIAHILKQEGVRYLFNSHTRLKMRIEYPQLLRVARVLMPAKAVFAGFLCLLLPLLTMAHNDPDMVEIKHVVEQYALGIIARDRELVATVLSLNGEDADFGLAGPVISVEMGFTRYDLSKAVFEVTDNGVTVGPVAFNLDHGVFVFVWDFDLVKESDGQWLISAIRPATQWLPEFFTTGLAAQTTTYPVAIQITDDDGRPVAARINITDVNGEYWPPRFHNKDVRTVFRDDVGGDVIIDDKTYAYVPSKVIADLPVGQYEIEVAKGMEFETSRTTFSVTGRIPEPLQIRVKRFVDMASRGWYSGDTHIHFVGDHNAVLEAEAESLNVANILAAGWGPLLTDVDRFTGQPSEVSTKAHVVYVNQETRHGWLGHTTMLRLSKLIHPLAWGGIAGMQEGVMGGFDYPSMAQQADRAHEQGGIVTWAHFPDPGGEVVVDVALEKVDAVDLFSFGGAFDPGSSMPDGSYAPGAVELYYKFLNTGSRLPVTGGTDKMYNTQTIGAVRTYAFVGSDFSYDGWIDAIKAGQTYVTTGPQLSFKVDGNPIGSVLDRKPGDILSLQAIAEIPPEYPADVLEIVQNGLVVAAIELEPGVQRTVLDFEVEVSGSGWLAARVRGSIPLPYQRNLILDWRGVPSMAHTSPIYIRTGKERVWSEEDAAFLADHVRAAIKWAQEVARYRDDTERSEILSLFRKALSVYSDDSR